MPDSKLESTTSASIVNATDELAEASFTQDLRGRLESADVQQPQMTAHGANISPVKVVRSDPKDASDYNQYAHSPFKQITHSLSERLSIARITPLVEAIVSERLLSRKLSSEEKDTVDMLLDGYSGFYESAILHHTRKELQEDGTTLIPLRFEEYEAIGSAIFALEVTKKDLTLANTLHEHEQGVKYSHSKIKNLKFDTHQFVINTLFHPEAPLTELLVREQNDENTKFETAILRGVLKKALPYLNENFGGTTVEKLLGLVNIVLRKLNKAHDPALSDLCDKELTYYQEKYINLICADAEQHSSHREQALAAVESFNDSYKRKIEQKNRRDKITNLCQKDPNNLTKILRKIATKNDTHKIDDLYNLILCDVTFSQEQFNLLIEILPKGVEVFINKEESAMRVDMKNSMLLHNGMEEQRNDSADLIILWAALHRMQNIEDPATFASTAKKIFEIIHNSARWSRYTDGYRQDLTDYFTALLIERQKHAEAGTVWPRFGKIQIV